MKDQRKLEMKVGATVLVGLVILLAGFAAFKEWTLFAAQKQVVMRFPTSAGLKSGDIVSLNGVEIGKVAAVALDKNAVIVTADVSQDTELMDGAAPVIQMLELMGGKKVEIYQGEGPGAIPPNTVIEGTVDPDIAGALHLIGELEGNIRSMGENANALMENANKILGDEKFIASVKSSAENVHALVLEARGLIADNRADVRDITRTLSGLTKSVDTLLATLEPRLQSTLDHTERTLTGADTLLASANAMVNDVRDGNGLVSRVLYDSTMMNRLDRVVSKLDSVLQIMINDDLKIRVGL